MAPVHVPQRGTDKELAFHPLIFSMLGKPTSGLVWSGLRVDSHYLLLILRREGRFQMDFINPSDCPSFVCLSTTLMLTYFYSFL